MWFQTWPEGWRVRGRRGRFTVRLVHLVKNGQESPPVPTYTRAERKLWYASVLDLRPFPLLIWRPEWWALMQERWQASVLRFCPRTCSALFGGSDQANLLQILVQEARKVPEPISVLFPAGRYRLRETGADEWRWVRGILSAARLEGPGYGTFSGGIDTIHDVVFQGWEQLVLGAIDLEKVQVRDVEELVVQAQNISRFRVDATGVRRLVVNSREVDVDKYRSGR